MTKLNSYLQDGANYQARAVMCMIQPWNIETSWCTETKQYLAEIKIARWENCREQGYVVSFRPGFDSGQLNIAFFEHRNSDSICAVMWEQVTLNSPTIDTADFGGKVYKDKWDVSHEVSYGQILEMSKWIYNQLENYWNKYMESKKK